MDFSQLSVGERLKLARKAKKLTQDTLGESIKVGKSQISNIENGLSELTTANAIVLSRKLGINEQWLLNGEGSGPEEYYDARKEAVNRNIKDFTKPGDLRKDEQLIPLYDITAAAGLNALHNSSQNILDYLRIPNLTKCDGAIYLKGDSMYPLLKHGDMVAFQQIHDIPEDIYYGEMYVVDMSTPHREKIVVKYVQKSELGPEYITLVSYNEKHHPPKDVHLSKVRAMAEVKASIRLT